MCKIFAQSQVFLIPDLTEVDIEEELKSLNDIDVEEAIELKNLRVVNCQMDSILKDIIKEKKVKSISSYYLALAKHNEKLR